MKKKMILLSNRILDILGVIALLCVISFVATWVFTGKPSFFGYRVMHVVSASMEPTIMTGDFVLTQVADADSVETGDIVTYRRKNEKGKLTNYTVIHRITGKNAAGQFIFIGDNNNHDDAPVDPEQITYKVIWY